MRVSHTMTLSAKSLRAFLAAHPAAVLGEIIAVQGSAPREAGAFMLVAPDAAIGTIGGGMLEHLVIARARQVFRGSLPDDGMDIALGPEIGQCCGGRVQVAIKLMSPALAASLVARLEAAEARLPHIYLFGAGHVGHALARALALLPVKAHVIDTRPGALGGLPDNVEARVVPMPEAVVRSAPEGSAFIILTHDHALDFLIAFEALKRADSPYVGMVGSKTKRARFRSWYLAEGGNREALRRLVLPIGATGLGDKRPEVIAALAAAEIMVHIGHREVSYQGARPATEPKLGAVVGD